MVVDKQNANSLLGHSPNARTLEQPAVMPLVPTSPGLSALCESDWKGDSQSCPLTSFALHNKGSAEMLCPSPHVAHPKTIAVAARIESHAVVFEYQHRIGSAA